MSLLLFTIAPNIYMGPSIQKHNRVLSVVKSYLLFLADMKLVFSSLMINLMFFADSRVQKVSTIAALVLLTICRQQ